MSRRDQKGFTIIETFVAITILLLAVLGPLSIMAKYFIDAKWAQNQIIATQLAQEGIELLISKRDFNLKNDPPEDPFAGFGSPSPCGFGKCDVDAEKDVNSEIIPCPGECLNLMRDESGSTAIYNHTNGSPTIFEREISVQEITAPPYGDGDPYLYHKFARVNVTVYWNKGRPFGGNAKVSTYLYDHGGY